MSTEIIHTFPDGRTIFKDEKGGVFIQIADPRPGTDDAQVFAQNVVPLCTMLGGYPASTSLAVTLAQMFCGTDLYNRDFRPNRETVGHILDILADALTRPGSITLNDPYITAKIIDAAKQISTTS